MTATHITKLAEAAKRYTDAVTARNAAAYAARLDPKSGYVPTAEYMDLMTTDEQRARLSARIAADAAVTAALAELKAVAAECGLAESDGRGIWRGKKGKLEISTDAENGHAWFTPAAALKAKARTARQFAAWQKGVGA